MGKNTSVFIVLLISLITLITGINVFFFVADNGIGVSPDSVAYIKTAESLLAGNGFYYFDEPLIHFPPLYPLLLAGSAIFSQNVTISAEWLHGILYGLNALLFGLAIFFSTRRSLVAMVLGILLFFSLQALLRIHAIALSEPPFLTFALILYIALGFYIKERKWNWLIITSLVVGFSLVTRYIGIVFVPVTALFLLINNNHPFKLRIRDFIVFLFISFLPLGLWLTRNYFLAQSATNRVFESHPITSSHIVTLVNNVHSFFLPQFKSSRANGFELLLLVILMVYMLIKIMNSSPNLSKLDPYRLYWMSFGFVFCAMYTIFLFFSISFYDFSTPLDYRFVSPLILFLNISFFSCVYDYAHTQKAAKTWLVLIVFTILIARFNLPSMIETARWYNSSGIGYNSLYWKNSPTILVLRQYPTRTRIFTNEFPGVQFQTKLHVIGLPIKFDRTSTKPNPQFEDEMKAMCTEINQGEALYVYVGESRENQPSMNEVLETCSPQLLFSLEDGSIYGEFKP